ncbi:glutathione S-transferase [Pusillimonas noertemannii]|uniref:Glutathione S-transferase n=2 Tax=Pusillimonas noertemannii TaxID=305977 RepID=A0A2U1CKE8_9BURK|nr:glutathione S-transferase [Pusillimonas noertemannii]
MRDAAAPSWGASLLYFLSLQLSDFAMKLFGSLTSPYVRKVRVVMAEKKLEYELVLDDVWSETSQIQQYNPLGKVPCLVMDDGGSLFDSRVIVEYLDTLSPVGRLLPQAGRDRTATKCWEAIADGVMDASVAIQVENTQRPEHLRSPDWINRQHGKINAALEFMEQGLEPNAFCMGVNFSLADVAVGCALGYLDLRLGQIDWRSQYPNLALLAEKLHDRPSFTASAPPAPAGQSQTQDIALNP